MIIKEISRTLLPNEISMRLNFHNNGFSLVGWLQIVQLVVQTSENL